MWTLSRSTLRQSSAVAQVRHRQLRGAGICLLQIYLVPIAPTQSTHICGPMERLLFLDGPAVQGLKLRSQRGSKRDRLKTKKQPLAASTGLHSITCCLRLSGKSRIIKLGAGM